MRRRHVHLGFALSTLIAAGLAAHQAVKLSHAHRVNAAIDQAATATEDSGAPEAAFAHAAVLARAGEYDAAVAAYKDLSHSKRADLRHAALFNLGNLHLRAALREESNDVMLWLPMVELAKQSYRMLLREQPHDWDARYNLERALQVAPEYDEAVSFDEGPPPERERSNSTVSNARMDLP